MPRKRKWKPGPRIHTLAQLLHLFKTGRLIFLEHKVYSPGWWGSIGLITLDRYIRHGKAWIAIPNTEESDD